jgi:hypothetical protein
MKATPVSLVRSPTQNDTISLEWASMLGRRVEIASFTRHLAAFCDPDRGPILRKTGKKNRFQYQFVHAPGCEQGWSYLAAFFTAPFCQRAFAAFSAMARVPIKQLGLCRISGHPFGRIQ